MNCQDADERKHMVRQKRRTGGQRQTRRARAGARREDGQGDTRPSVVQADRRTNPTPAVAKSVPTHSVEVVEQRGHGDVLGEEEVPSQQIHPATVLGASAKGDLPDAAVTYGQDPVEGVPPMQGMWGPAIDCMITPLEPAKERLQPSRRPSSAYVLKKKLQPHGESDTRKWQLRPKSSSGRLPIGADKDRVDKPRLKLKHRFSE